MPYAIYLMRNFLGTPPLFSFESAYLDGLIDRLPPPGIPLAMPAIVSLAIFQFWFGTTCWLPWSSWRSNPVMTHQISNTSPASGGWQLVSGCLPVDHPMMIVSQPAALLCAACC
jgi:alpha-glucoside transport system permease protein